MSEAIPVSKLIAGVGPWLALAAHNKQYEILLERFLVLIETKRLNVAEQDELELIERMLDSIEAEHSN